MNQNLQTLFGLIGGLSLFLFGMNSMSDALQKAAGEKMKHILSMLTRNPLMGALAGTLVTAVLQSSSATTVMVIGFVSAGLMGLPQAISVIFGANIGTTMTAQLLAFDITDYIYPIIFIGFMVNFLAKKERARNIGMVVFSFGLLFEGIAIMSSVMEPLANSPIFIDLMGHVKEVPVLGILLGLGMTLVVQSSSATIAVLQNFAQQAGSDGVSSVIGLAGAIPILLGDNIGTTITALLASIGQSKNAKRTAVAHSCFNISGTIVFAFILPWFARFVEWISPKGSELDVISRQIANAHTTFNVVCTIVWLPLIPLMVKIVTLIVPGEDANEVSHSKPMFLDEGALGQPVAAMVLVSKEIDRCAAFTTQLIKRAQHELTGMGEKNPADFDDLQKSVKQLGAAISGYLARMMAGGGLTEEQSEQAAGLLYVANSIDRIADRCIEVTADARGIRGEGKGLSEDAAAELNDCFAITEQMFSAAMDAVRTGSEDSARTVSAQKGRMHKAQKQFNKAHLARVKKKTCDPSLTGAFSDILYGLDRMSDNCLGIAEEARDSVCFMTIEENRGNVLA